jgi:hypothetical protein
MRDILWNEADREVIRLRAAFRKIDSSLPVLDAIRHVIVSVNVYQAKDVPEVRTRMNLSAAAALMEVTPKTVATWLDEGPCRIPASNHGLAATA